MVSAGPLTESVATRWEAASAMVPEDAPIDAVIVAVPLPTDVTRPGPLTWRTPSSLVTQLRKAVECGLPTESVATTSSCTRWPMEWKVSMAAVKVMMTGTSSGFVAESPQPADPATAGNAAEGDDPRVNASAHGAYAAAFGLVMQWESRLSGASVCPL